MYNKYVEERDLHETNKDQNGSVIDQKNNLFERIKEKTTSKQQM